MTDTADAPPPYDAVLARILILASDDYTHLGYVWQAVREGGVPAGQELGPGLECIRRLLADGMVLLGGWADGIWEGTADELVARVGELASELGRLPSEVDQPYLLATTAGERAAESLAARGERDH